MDRSKIKIAAASEPQTTERIHLTPDKVESHIDEDSVRKVGLTLSEQLDYIRSRPYKAYTTQCHKGNYAEKGMTYLVVEMKTTFLTIDRKYSNARQFPTKELENQGIKNLLYDKLWEFLRNKYPHAQLPE